MALATATPANKYLDELNRQAAKFNTSNYSTRNTQSQLGLGSEIQDNTPVGQVNTAPNQQATYSNPNEHFTAQQSLLDGGIPASPTTRKNEVGLQERDLATAASGDIADSISHDAMSQRKTQLDKLIASYRDSSNLNGLGADYTGDGGYFAGGGGGEQMSIAQQIQQIGKQRGLGDDAITIALMAGLAESGLKNLNNGHMDSLGIFQQRPSQGWGSAQQVTNPSYAINKFFDGLQSVNYKAMAPWSAAQAVQKSAFSDGSNYQAQFQKAQGIMGNLNSGAYKTAGNSVNNPGLNSWIQAHDNKYLDYDNAYGAQCVDLYAFYTTGFAGGTPNPVGYAPEIFNNYDTKAYAKFAGNSPARSGDVAVFGVGPVTPSGHVAIVVGDNGNGTLRVLQSNATSLGSAGNSVISNISKSTLMGYLRPRKLM